MVRRDPGHQAWRDAGQHAQGLAEQGIAALERGLAGQLQAVLGRVGAENGPRHLGQGGGHPDGFFPVAALVQKHLLIGEAPVAVLLPGTRAR